MSPKAVVLAVAWLLTMTAVAGAQDAALTEVPIQEELARLNTTLQEIVKLLKMQVEGQETSLLIKRAELNGRTLIAKQERLRKARREAADLEDQEVSLTQIVEVFEQELSEAVEDGASQRLELDQMELQLKSVKRRRQDLARELMVLENDVSSEEEDMEVLEAVLDERLGLR